jgi:hypothetical protein
MSLFVSGRPSSRAHFPYQAGLRGNSSPLDPLALFARTTCEPPCRHPVPVHLGQCHRPGHCLELRPDVRLTGQLEPPFLFLPGKDEQCSPLFSLRRSCCSVCPLAAFLHHVVYQVGALLLHPPAARHSASPHRYFSDRCLSPPQPRP